MKVLSVDLSKLIFDPNNARKHSAKNLEAIKGSLTKFGQQKPVVINSKNLVIAGNGTVEAARLLGWKTIKATVSDLDDFHQAAFAIADNRSAELAEWDLDILTKTLSNLNESMEITILGFEGTDFLTTAPDYSIMEDENPDLGGFKNGVRKALQIEFELEKYDEAFQLVKFWRERGGNVGQMLVEKLLQEKKKL